MRHTLFALTLGLGLLLVKAPSASACPSCGKAVAGMNGGKSEDSVRAFQVSILFMMGVPASLLAFYGVAFFRLMRKANAGRTCVLPGDEEFASAPSDYVAAPTAG